MGSPCLEPSHGQPMLACTTPAHPYNALAYQRLQPCCGLCRVLIVGPSLDSSHSQPKLARTTPVHPHYAFAYQTLSPPPAVENLSHLEFAGDCLENHSNRHLKSIDILLSEEDPYSALRLCHQPSPHPPPGD